jgi:hypothetical protein
MKRHRFLSAAFALIVIIAGLSAGRLFADQPRMHAALDHLRNARAELQAAASGKGGHRERALELTGRAIAEVEAGIEFDRTH